MIDRFTESAKRAMNLARQNAQRLNHEYLGTEHILLGLLDEECRALSILDSLRIERGGLRAELAKLVEPGAGRAPVAALPFTPRSRKALEYTFEEALSLGSRVVGTEHLLLGLARVGNGVASEALSACGFSLANARVFAKEPGGSPEGPADAEITDFRSARRLHVLEEAVEALLAFQEPDLAAKLREVARKLGSRKWGP